MSCIASLGSGSYCSESSNKLTATACSPARCARKAPLRIDGAWPSSSGGWPWSASNAEEPEAMISPIRVLFSGPRAACPFATD
eukprot:948346-Prymnesium_polylepis.1